MRIGVSNWSTRDSDVERSVAAMLRLARAEGVAADKDTAR